ncbi:hypothetical protein HG530_002376 [Fusarium avenaceum]|nr:hypothetical protein HG530_002376 [Fusarium avenaceum]
MFKKVKTALGIKGLGLSKARRVFNVSINTIAFLGAHVVFVAIVGIKLGGVFALLDFARGKYAEHSHLDLPSRLRRFIVIVGPRVGIVRDSLNGGLVVGAVA